MPQLTVQPYGGQPVAVDLTVTPTILWGARMDSEVYGVGADAPWDAATWDHFEQDAGKRVSLCSFGQPPPWSQAFAAGPFESCRARGALAVCDMGTWDVPLADILAGAYDAAITTWANAVKVYGRPIMLRFNWECNGTWFGWGAQAKTNPQRYVDVWRRFRGICDARGATNITWVWNVNLEFSGSTSLASLYPGDAFVDWVGIDGYNWGTNPLKPDAWRSFTTLYAPTYAALRALAPSKPIMVNEVGCTEVGGNKAAWITAMFAALAGPDFQAVRAFSWFNWNVTQGSGRMDWPITSSTAARDAFRAGVAATRYRSGGYGSLPLLSKITPP